MPRAAPPLSVVAARTSIEMHLLTGTPVPDGVWIAALRPSHADWDEVIGQATEERAFGALQNLLLTGRADTRSALAERILTALAGHWPNMQPLRRGSGGPTVPGHAQSLMARDEFLQVILTHLNPRRTALSRMMRELEPALRDSAHSQDTLLPLNAAVAQVHQGDLKTDTAELLETLEVTTRILAQRFARPLNLHQRNVLQRFTPIADAFSVLSGSEARQALTEPLWNLASQLGLQDDTRTLNTLSYWPDLDVHGPRVSARLGTLSWPDPDLRGPYLSAGLGEPRSRLDALMQDASARQDALPLTLHLKAGRGSRLTLLQAETIFHRSDLEDWKDREDLRTLGLETLTGWTGPGPQRRGKRLAEAITERPSRQLANELLELNHDALRRLRNTAALHEGLRTMGRWNPVLKDRLYPLLQSEN